MKRKWILIGLAVGLLAAAISGGVALAWGGGGHGWGWGRGDHEERKTAVAGKVAEALGTDAQETADAIAQAEKEVSEEAQNAALQDFAGRVATTLGTDADATANAIKQVAEEMRSEALETRLQSAIDSGRITEEEAQEYRDKAGSSGWFVNGFGFKGYNDAENFANRVAAILEVEGDDAADAFEQAMTDIRSEAMESTLQSAIDSGKITEEEAAEIRERVESGNWRGFDKRGRGHRGGKGHWGRGRGHHGGHGSESDSSIPSTPANDEDSA